MSAAATTLTACGSSQTATPAALRLQREDLVAVGHALHTVERPVAVETAAAKRAWALVANGLPSPTPSIAAPAVTAASASAAKISLPAQLSEPQAASLTGPASQLAGLFRTFSGLIGNGWGLIGAAIGQIERGSPAAARFSRENVALYIESVYDGHFGLAQIGKKLLAGYKELGGPPSFGDLLTQGEVDSLARHYSEATERLHPHVGVRLGS